MIKGQALGLVLFYAVRTSVIRQTAMHIHGRTEVVVNAAPAKVLPLLLAFVLDQQVDQEADTAQGAEKLDESADDDKGIHNKLHLRPPVPATNGTLDGKECAQRRSHDEATQKRGEDRNLEQLPDDQIQERKNIV